MNGSFIWDFTVITKWSFHEREDSGDEETYSIAAPDFDKAVEKLKKLVVSKSRSWEDTDAEGIRHKYVPVSMQIVKAERMQWIDG